MQTAVIDSSKEEKIKQLTKDMQPWVAKSLRTMPDGQFDDIYNYIKAMQREINIRKSTKKNLVVFLIHFSKSNKHKSFRDMVTEDLQLYLDSYRKTEEDDPFHKWIGTYNQRIGLLGKFFRWLCFPELEHWERAKLKPPMMQARPPHTKAIRSIKRVEESIYTSNDMWTEEDDALFLKYCPDTEIKAYHTMRRDTSARPHEILKLDIADIDFRVSPNGSHYAEVVPNGKTGQRPLPLFHSVAYIKKWLNEHPMATVSGAPLFPNTMGKNRGRHMQPNNLYMRYVVYYQKGVHTKKRKSEGYFQRLLHDPSVPAEDKVKIEQLLRKPWNPYVGRHSALKDKAKILSGPMMDLHAGWKPGSKMARRYLHFIGSEANDKIFEVAGVMPREKTMQEILKPRICTNCQTPNTAQAQFCENPICKMPLNFNAFQDMKKETEAIVRQMVESMLMEKHGRKATVN